MMMIKSLLALILFGGGSQALASDAIIFGHNMSPTTYTLSRGEASVGNFIAGVGLTDRLTIGTSPWMYSSYNMYSLVGRYAYELDERDRLSVQAAYFKTGRFLSDVYQMEATSVWVSGGRKLTPHYTINLVFNHMPPRNFTVQQTTKMR